MKEKELIIKSKNISPKQWSTLILELNSISKSWKRFGVDIKVSALNAERIIKWGNKNHDDDDLRPQKSL